MKKTVSIILVLLFLFLGASCIKHDKYGTYQKEIDVIYVEQMHVGRYTTNCKIDLKEKKFYEYATDYEGFEFVSDLDEEDIGGFIRRSARNNLTGWKEEYIDPNIEYGHEWKIQIHFADGKEKKSYGSNKYPYNVYKNMAAAFHDLTDTEILWINEQGQYE